MIDRGGRVSFSMRALAAEVGLSPMAAYQYFANLEALRVELWQAVMEDLTARMRGAAARQADALEAWFAMVDALLVYAWEFPRRFEFVFHDPIVDAIRHDESRTGTRLGLLYLSHELLGRAAAEGKIRTDRTVQELMVGALATVQGLGELIVSQRSASVFAQDLDAMTAVSRRWIWDAIAPR